MKYPGRMISGIFGLITAVFTLYIVYAADTGTLPPSIIRLYRFPGGDKAGHVLIFGILTLGLSALLHPRRIRLRGISLPAGMVLTAVLTTLEEISQRFIAGRTFDLLDLACSYLGIVLGFLAWMLLKPARRTATR